VLTSDEEAWAAFPHHRDWFDKLRFSLVMGHLCGPCGVAPPVSGDYVVRPVYNLSGMGAGARRAWIAAGDTRSVPPGHFWCEWFDGPQHSVTYRWDGAWVPVSSWRGSLAEGSLTRFVSWRRAGFLPTLPPVFDVLADCGLVNVEWVGDHPIEVHLRASPDPDDGDEIVPVWADDPVDGYVAAFDDADGFIGVPRLGFVVR
jgi:hypothetical protein